MATRFYYEDDGTVSGGSRPGTSNIIAPPITPAFDASWEVTTSAIRRWLTQSGAKFGTTMVNSGAFAETNAGTVDVLFGQFISSKLAGQTISGTVKGQMRVLESATDADFRAQIVIWVAKPDGTSRGTLLASDASALSSEFAASFTNRKFPLAAVSPVTLSSLAVTAGDRLVVEVGYRSHNATTTSKQAQFRYGTAAASDLAEDETATTDDNPWIEFSGTITFPAEEADITQTLVEMTVADTTPGMRVTQNFVEAVLTDTTPQMRISQTLVEAVVERDYAGWGTHIIDEIIPPTTDWVSME